MLRAGGYDTCLKMEEVNVQTSCCPFGSVQEFEAYAKKNFPADAYNYVAGGHGECITLKENSEAFKRIKILPRYLQGFNCMEIDPSTKILGKQIAFPICASPVGLQKVAHPDGELATARACSRLNTCMAACYIANTSYEDIAEASSGGIRWLQIYIPNEISWFRQIVNKARSNGYDAIVLTVDDGTSFAKSAGIEVENFRKDFIPPEQLRFPNLESLMDNFEDLKTTSEKRDLFYKMHAASFSKSPEDWKKMMGWLRSETNLPIIIKGILSVEDAQMAAELGVDGIIVSNHGARILDGLPATIEMLPRISEAVGDKLEIFLDGGIRSGSDVFKALALGAKAVFVGRPVLWGLAYNGQEGLEALFKILRDQLKFTMGMAGCAKVSDIKRSHVISQHQLSSFL